MPELKLLEFFRIGSLGGVKPGMSREEVEKILGYPDCALGALDESPDRYKTAGIWLYGGIQFCFGIPPDRSNILEGIDFKPHYLFRYPKEASGERLKTKVRRWIFRSRQGPTKQQLAEALSKHSIAYQDTSLEMLIWNEEISNFQVIEYQEHLLTSSEAQAHRLPECFGTLVLKSGVQVRYDEKDQILRVGNGVDWSYKGKESAIVWKD
jgi:hypothetical protein